MYRKSLVLVLLLFKFASSEHGKENDEKRNPRFLSFSSFDDDNMKIDLEFAIPFLSIPIKKMVNSFGGSMKIPPITVNSPSLVLAGILIFSSTVLLPLLLKHKTPNHYHRFSRVLENTEFGDDMLLSAANQVFREGQNWSGCPQKFACWTGQKVFDRDPMKIWNPIINNELLSSFVNTSSIEEAISSGRKGSDCNIYSPCKLNEEFFSMFWKNMAILTNS